MGDPIIITSRHRYADSPLNTDELDRMLLGIQTHHHDCIRTCVLIKFIRSFIRTEQQNIHNIIVVINVTFQNFYSTGSIHIFRCIRKVGNVQLIIIYGITCAGVYFFTAIIILNQIKL